MQRLSYSNLSTSKPRVRFIVEEICWLAQQFYYFSDPRSIFINDRSTKFDRDIQSKASELSKVTETRNSEIRVSVIEQNIQVQSIEIKLSRMVKDLAPRPRQRQKQHSISQNELSALDLKG